MKNPIEIEVARLDGYLSGVTSLNGKIRDYSAFSFLVESEGKEDSLENAIKKFFLPHAHFNFSTIKKLKNGLRDLESEIRPFLIINTLNSNYLDQMENDIDDRKKYLSFRVMDSISGMLGRAGQTTDVFRLEGSCDESPSKCVFFGMVVENFFLILQFNNDTNQS